MKWAAVLLTEYCWPFAMNILSPAFAGSILSCFHLGLTPQGFMLAPAAQAKCKTSCAKPSYTSFIIAVVCSHSGARAPLQFRELRNGEFILWVHSKRSFQCYTCFLVAAQSLES